MSMMHRLPQQPAAQQCNSRQKVFTRTFRWAELRPVKCAATLPIEAAAARLQQHPASQQPKDESPAKEEESPRFDVESDIRYRRADMSDIFAYDAKQAFASLLSRGEPGLALAEAALQVTAEDDALISHSTVRFPVESYLQRIDRLADECALRLRQAGCHAQQAQQEAKLRIASNTMVEEGRGSSQHDSTSTRLQSGGESSHGTNGGTSSDSSSVTNSSQSGSAAEDRTRSGEGASSSSSSSSMDTSLPSPQKVLDVVAQYLLVEQRFKVTQHGRSNLPRMSVVDHPGTWEDAQHGYLHTLLVRRIGHPAMVALLFAEVMKRLLSKGAVDFAITMAPGSFEGLPRAVVIPGMIRQQLLISPRQTSSHSGSSSSSSSGGASNGSSSSAPASSAAATIPSASSSSSANDVLQSDPDPEVLNTCTSEVLVEALRHLKRAYWPFQWDSSVDAYEDGGRGSHGGFRAAAKVASGEAMSEAIRAISQVASWRLQRGIWTSPGAGDIRRAIAACERLVMMIGDEVPEERRDLAVLLVHNGDIGGARAELRAYMRTPSFSVADPFDRLLCQKLSSLLAVAENVTEPPEVVSIASVLRLPPPDADNGVKLPLTW